MTSETSENTIFLRFYDTLCYLKSAICVRIQPADTDVFPAGVRIVVDFYCREKRPAEIYVCVRGIRSFRSIVISLQV